MKPILIVALLLVIVLGQLSKVTLSREVVLEARKSTKGAEAFIEVYLKFPYVENYYSDLFVVDNKGAEIYRNTVLIARDAKGDTKSEFTSFKWDGNTLVVQGRSRYTGPTQLEF